MITSIISFKQIPFIKKNGIKIAAPYTIPVKNDADAFVRIEEKDKKNAYATVIKNEYCDEFARNNFDINIENKVLSNGNMDVKEIKNREKGFGAVMHLNNIIELFENDLDKIELFSTGSAIPFHAKYKFEPILNNKDTIEDFLYLISLKDSSEFPEIEQPVKAAGKYLDEIHYTGGYYCLNKDKLKYAKDIVISYIDAINSKKLTPAQREKYGFESGIEMVLTKEKILENKDFFNSLFKSHGIDYKI